LYQKDYILRMIAMMGKFIGEVLGLIKRGDLKKASEELEKGYSTFLREDAALFRNIPEDKLTNTLLAEHNYTNGHLEILAELFYAEAELELAQGNNNGNREFSRKALLLYEFVDKEQKLYSQERLDKIDILKKRISGFR
jgi:hypothetical protein